MKNFTLFLISVFFSTFIFAQTISPELEFAQQKLEERGEFYFTFPVAENEIMLALNRQISIDGFKDGLVYAYANQNEFETFLEYGIEFSPVYDYYNPSKALTMATTVAQMANWDRYPTHAVYLQMMQNFATDYPDLCQYVQYGYSENGVPIVGVIISDNIETDEDEPEFWWSGTMHGDELVCYALTLRLADYLLSNYGTDPMVTYLVDNMEIHINPLANPDGTFYNSASLTSVSSARRYNINNIDLNRNFPTLNGDSYTMQDEIQLMMDYAANNDFVMSVNTHSGIELINFPWDTWQSWERTNADHNWWQYVCFVYANEVEVDAPSTYFEGPGSMDYGAYNTTGVTHGADWYYAIGSRQDYMNYHRYIQEVTLEWSDTKLLDVSLLPTYWGYNKDAMLLYMEQSLFGLRGIVTDACTGTPLDNVKVEIIGHDVDNSFVFSSAPVGNYHRPIYEGTYDFTFSLTGYQTQTHTVTITNDVSTRLDIELIPNGVASPDFSASSINVIIGSDVDFTDLTSGTVTSIEWTFEGGNPATSGDANPTVNYATEGVYDVSLEIESAGCTVTELKEDYITVYIPGAPVAGFTSDVTTTCTGIVQFTNTTVDAETYEWDFGDGNTSEEENPLHTFTESGTFTVSLIAYNPYGDDIYSITDMITVNLPEAPITTGDESCGAASLTLTASGPGTLAWYDSPTEGTEVTTGTSYTHTFSESTTLYVQSEVENLINENFGPLNNSIGTGGYFGNVSYIHGLIFDALTDFTLVSVWVDATGTKDRVINLFDENDDLVETVTVNIANGQSRITLNMDVPAGNNYTLVCDGDADLYRNQTGGSYPYTLEGVASIHSNTADNLAYYYYFYDWEVEYNVPCVSARVPVTATIHDLSNLDLGTAQTQCGGTVILDAGEGFISYEWNGAPGSQTFEVSTSDNYEVVVEDANGCTASDNVDVTINTVPTAVIVSGGTTQCGGIVDLSATGGTGGTIYWQGITSGGISTVTPTTAQSVTESGTYYFRARSTEGCWGEEGFAEVVINDVPTAVIVSGGGTQCGGSMTLTTTGGEGGTIYWQNTTSGGTSTVNPATQETVSVSGTYYFRARSAEGCWGEEGSASVTINPSFTVEANATDESAPGANDGSITVEMTGGTPPYVGTWTPSGTTNTDETTMTLTGLTGGNYSVVVEDATGCIAEAEANVNTIGAPPVAAFETDVISGCDELIVHFTDLSTNNPIAWEWSFGDGGTSDAQNPVHTYTEPGSYTVTLLVENATESDTEMIDNFITIGESPTLEMSMTQVTVLGNDGTASVIATGGSTPYSYEWSVVGSTSIIEGLTAGEYCVTVTEYGNGCESVDCIMVTEEGAALPIADFVADDTDACQTLTVHFTDLTVNDPIAWEWNFGDGGESDEQNPVHTYSTPGIYTVSLTATNTEGSDEEVKIDYISIYAKPELSFTISHETGVGNADGEIELTITGGSEPYTINWSNNQHSLIITDLSAGLYSVAVIDDNGCMATGFAEVQVVSEISFSDINTLSIYPNPSDGNFFIESDELIKSVKIFDATGKLCVEQNTNNSIVEIWEINTSGLYLICIETENSVINQRIVIK